MTRTLAKQPIYVEILKSEVPDGVRFHVPARYQGQTVERAYGTAHLTREADEGDLWFRIHDHSDRSTRYFRLK